MCGLFVERLTPHNDGVEQQVQVFQVDFSIPSLGGKVLFFYLRNDL